MLISPFSLYYFLNNELFLGGITLGIIINCLCVIIIGFYQIKDKEENWGFKKTFDKKNVTQINEQHPKLLFETLTIVITTIIPFLLLILVLINFFRLFFNNSIN